MKVVFRTNVGSMDAKQFGLDHKKCLAGKTLDVEKEAGEQLVKSGLAVAEEDAKDDAVIQSALGVPDGTAQEEETVKEPEAAVVPEESPVSGENAHEAIEKIGRMTSKPRLQQIVDHDKRPTVQDAARERLAAL